MPLDPQAQAYLEQVAAAGAPTVNMMSPAVARANAEKASLPPGPEVAKVEDRTIPGPDGEVPVRVYTPAGPGPFPVLVWFHGGGWVRGSVNISDGTVRHLTNMGDCVVVSVDYRLAPEAKFPAAAEDCYAATAWVGANTSSINADPDRIAVGGDSAGGNLAAVVPLMARDRGGPSLLHQVLVYPVIERDFTTRSYTQCSEGYSLTRDAMVWFWDQYLRDEGDATHPYVAPLHAKDLSGLPPALVITAEFDPLRDEGAAYARRLSEAGVPTKHSDYSGMIHGFFRLWWAMDRSKEALSEVAATLKEAFAPSPQPSPPSTPLRAGIEGEGVFGQGAHGRISR